MTRSSKKNSLIAALLLVLILLLWWTIWLGKEQQRASLQQLLFAQDQATSIVIERADTALEFTRENSLWRMQKPQQAAAREQRIVPLLSLLSLPRSHRYAIKDLDLAELGLDPPQATIRINHLQFQFGHADLAGEKRYLCIDNAVYLIDDLIFPLISSPASEFIADQAAEQAAD